MTTHLLREAMLKHAAAADSGADGVPSSLRDHEREPLDTSDSEENELIAVFSNPVTAAPSRAPSRPPSRSGTRRPAALASPLNPATAIARAASHPARALDPIRMLRTEINQRIFALLDIRDLARCARVCRRWRKSQTINYVWFQHYRKENFHDESLPPGKWTKRESKQNWSSMYAQHVVNRTPPQTPHRALRSRSGRSTPGGSLTASPPWASAALNAAPSSGTQTPREQREERWRREAAATLRPGKVEMREAYKELGGRKSRSKNKLGSTGGTRDKGGWAVAIGGGGGMDGDAYY